MPRGSWKVERKGEGEWQERRSRDERRRQKIEEVLFVEERRRRRGSGSVPADLKNQRRGRNEPISFIPELAFTQSPSPVSLLPSSASFLAYALALSPGVLSTRMSLKTIAAGHGRS